MIARKRLDTRKQLHAYLRLDRVLGNELVDMHSPVLADPIKVTTSAFCN